MTARAVRCDQDEVAGAAERLGARALAGKACCAARARLPWLLCRRRTVRGVAAYFDLITGDGRLFFGDSFHFGFFPDGGQTLAQALDAHTDLVCELAGIRPGMRVLDVGCGIGEPARRIASRIDCEIVGLNISREQVRQGRELIAAAGLTARVDIRHGNVLQMPLPDADFDAVICLEAGGDICVRAADKPRLLAELRRVLRPGGQVGFSDLAFDRLRTGRCARCFTTRAPNFSPTGRACSRPPGFSWERCATSMRRRCRPGSTSSRCTASTRSRSRCVTAGGSALVSPAASTARSARPPARSDAAAATRRSARPRPAGHNRNRARCVALLASVTNPVSETTHGSRSTLRWPRRSAIPSEAGPALPGARFQ
jgi:ubiquinone/menaquinone biosynthesis C-methylase UbiE